MPAPTRRSRTRAATMASNAASSAHTIVEVTLRAPALSAGRYRRRGRPVRRVCPSELPARCCTVVAYTSYDRAYAEGAVWTGPTGTAVGPKIIASTAPPSGRPSRCAGCSAARWRSSRRPCSTSPTLLLRQVPVRRRAPATLPGFLRTAPAEVRRDPPRRDPAAGRARPFRAHGAPADPYMTLVGCFNAGRRAGGMAAASTTTSPPDPSARPAFRGLSGPAAASDAGDPGVRRLPHPSTGLAAR